MAHAEAMSVLSRDECLRLLAAGGIGRVSVPTTGAPAIRPVNFALDGSRIVFRTGDSVLWRASQERRPAEFEIDDTSREDHTGWSVIVTGRLDEIPPAAEPEDLTLRPWAGGERPRLVALSTDEIGGRRVGPVRAAAPRPARVPAPWGRSPQARGATARLVAPLDRWWFRTEWEGQHHIPRHRGALLVANHAGAVPVDAVLVMHGIERDLGRPVFGLHHHGLRATPFLGRVLERNGGVVAHPDNALRLLRDEHQLVLVFPEGTKGTTKPFRDRYQLARFGRGGFIEVAMRAGVPVVPVAIAGTEESMPTLFRLPTGREEGVPITLNQLLLGPLGALTHFPVKVRIRVLDPVTFPQAPDLGDYPASEVAAASEEVRARLQAALDELVGPERRVRP